MALMASSSISGNALKNFAMFTAARRLRDAWGEWESLIAWTNASLLCAGNEVALEHHVVAYIVCKERRNR